MSNDRDVAARILVHVLPRLEEANRNDGPSAEVEVTNKELTLILGHEPSSDEIIDAISVIQVPWEWTPTGKKRPRASGGGLFFWEVYTNTAPRLKVRGSTDRMLTPLVALGFIS